VLEGSNSSHGGKTDGQGSVDEAEGRAPQKKEMPCNPEGREGKQGNLLNFQAPKRKKSRLVAKKRTTPL